MAAVRLACVFGFELAAVNEKFILNEKKIDELQRWVGDHYREQLAPNDLLDPKLLDESIAALKALQDLLGVQNLYPDLVEF